MYHRMSEFTAGFLQVFLTNGRLQMYRNKEVVHSGEVGDGVCFVINGIVKVACIDLKDTQDYFLGSGEQPLPDQAPLLHDSACFGGTLTHPCLKGRCSLPHRLMMCGPLE